jgi:heme-degrading monooxygenase HmoA
MSVLMTADMDGATQEMIEGMNAALDGPMKRAKGFVSHANGPVPGGWRVTEVWDSEDDFTAWFEANVKLTLPAGAPVPAIKFDQLHHAFTA